MSDKPSSDDVILLKLTEALCQFLIGNVRLAGNSLQTKAEPIKPEKVCQFLIGNVRHQQLIEHERIAIQDVSIPHR
jgi:hypothetical protein|nr:MAG TPA: hypothetical protein [Bacteriophage sp.]